MNSKRRTIVFVLTIVIIIGLVGTGLWLLKPHQRFDVGGVSMEPTYHPGDQIALTHISQDVRLQRGDVVTFTLSSGQAVQAGGAIPTTDVMIKRIVGLPGDRLSIDHGQVSVNGSPLVEHYLAAGVKTDTVDGKPIDMVIPENEYFLLGDNRGQAIDSRNFGLVARTQISGIVGKIIGHNPGV